MTAGRRRRRPRRSARPCPWCVAADRVVALGSADQRQPRGRGPSRSPRSRRAQPPRRPRPARRAGPVTTRGAVRAAEHVEGALAAVGHRHLVARASPAPRRRPPRWRRRPRPRWRVPRNLSGAATSAHVPLPVARRPVCRATDRVASPTVAVTAHGRPTTDRARVQPRPGLVRGATTTASWSPSGAPAGWCRDSRPLIAGTDARGSPPPCPTTTGRRPGGVDRRPRAFRVRLAAPRPDDYRMAYDVIGNADAVVRATTICTTSPAARASTAAGAQAWEAYAAGEPDVRRRGGRDAPEDAVVLVQDYHLCPAGARARRARPDLRLVHFPTRPSPAPDAVGAPRRRRPRAAGGHGRQRRLRLPHGALGAAFERLLRGRRRRPRHHASSPRSAPTPTIWRRGRRRRPAPPSWPRARASVGDRQLIVRVDRIELSKNLLRGFHAYDDLLEQPPGVARAGWCSRAFVYPSREGLAEYLAYRQEVEASSPRSTSAGHTDGWTPILLEPATTTRARWRRAAPLRRARW